MYCGVGALFPHEYPWVANLLKVRNSSQRVPVRIYGRIPRIDFILFSNFCVVHITIFCCVCFFKNKVNLMQSGVLLMYNLHYAYLFVSAYYVQIVVLHRYCGERNNNKEQSVSSQICHLVKDTIELKK